MTETRARPSPTERWRGTLLGHAAGNIAGRGLHPTGGGVPLPTREARDAPFDDDVALAMLISEALLHGGPLSSEDLGARFLQWHRNGARGIGWLTSQVLREIEFGTPIAHASMVVWHRYGRTPAGNGALARSIPIPLRWTTDRASRWAAAATAARLTHFDPRCVWSTVAFADILAQLLVEIPSDDSTLDLEQITHDLVSAGAPEEIVEVVSSDRPDLRKADLADRFTQGYTVKTLQVAVWAAQAEGDFYSVLAPVLEAGGDIDTNAAVAGAIMGARLGEGAIPVGWMPSDTSGLAYLAGRLLKLCRWNG